MADLSSIRQALQKHIKEEDRSEKERWYLTHYVIAENQYQGKLVADVHGETVSSGQFYRLPYFTEDGKIRSRYYRYYPNNPIEKVIKKATESGLLREGQVWRYDKRLITKIMFLIQKLQNPEERVELQRLHLLYIRGVRANQQILQGIRNILSTEDVDEETLANTFDPSKPSFRVALNYIPGRDGSTSLTLTMAQYQPPLLPPEVKSFELASLGIPTQDEWEPNFDEYQEAAEQFQRVLEQESKDSVPAPSSKASTQAPKAPKVKPGSKITKGEYTYEITESGYPTCFTQADASDPRCLKCDFLAECLAS